MIGYLSEDRGGRSFNLIETAIRQGLRPTTYLLRVQPGKPWSKWDFLCGEAYAGVIAERCPQCGLPRWLCHNEDGDIGMKIVKDTCFGIKELETVEEKKSNKKGYKAPKGEKSRPEPWSYSGKPFDGTTREAFYKNEWEKLHPDEA